MPPGPHRPLRSDPGGLAKHAAPLLVAALAALLACGDDAGSSAGALPGKLRTCGLLGSGTVRPRERSALSECVAECRAGASCDELAERYCHQTASGQLLDCEAACFDPIDCGASGGTYTLLERCDGKPQCKDGRDEHGCGTVRQAARYCDGGERIWTFQQCNGMRDCKDGTDEQDCPVEAELFVCKGSIPQRVLKSQVCDLVLDCIDGSDESAAQGCAQLCR